jgi:hypothetical protein
MAELRETTRSSMIVDLSLLELSAALDLTSAFLRFRGAEGCFWVFLSAF